MGWHSEVVPVAVRTGLLSSDSDRDDVVKRRVVLLHAEFTTVFSGATGQSLAEVRGCVGDLPADRDDAARSQPEPLVVTERVDLPLPLEEPALEPLAIRADPPLPLAVQVRLGDMYRWRPTARSQVLPARIDLVLGEQLAGSLVGHCLHDLGEVVAEAEPDERRVRVTFEDAVQVPAEFDPADAEDVF